MSSVLEDIPEKNQTTQMLAVVERAHLCGFVVYAEMDGGPTLIMSRPAMIYDICLHFRDSIESQDHGICEICDPNDQGDQDEIVLIEAVPYTGPNFAYGVVKTVEDHLPDLPEWPCWLCDERIAHNRLVRDVVREIFYNSGCQIDCIELHKKSTMVRLVGTELTVRVMEKSVEVRKGKKKKRINWDSWDNFVKLAAAMEGIGGD